MLINKNYGLSEVLKIVFDELNAAALDPGHPFRFLSLATTRQQVPDIRYVVLRSMDAAWNLYFFTDYRTKKIDHIRANPEVALLFYDSQKRVQLRVKGKALIHRNNPLANQHWKSVDGEAQKAYNPIIKPGTLISHPDEAYSWPDNLSSTNFVVVQVIPTKLDVLQLDGFNHIRAKFERNGETWKMDWVAP